MNIKIIAIFVIFLLVGSSFANADIIEDIEKGVEKTGVALSESESTDIIVNVDSYYPTVLSEQAFESDQPGGYLISATLKGVKTNPLMDLEKIESIHVRATGGSTKYGRVYYKPPRYGYTDLNNLGYVVIRLNNLKENDVPKRLDINMTADIRFKIQKGFGVTENDMTLEILDEEEFLNEKNQHGFWSGRGYINLVNIKGDTAYFTVYDGSMNKNSFSVKEGKESKEQYLRGGTPYMLREEEDFIGRDLRNTYKIRVDEITGNKDVAKVEMLLNGKYVLKDLYKGKYLYEGSQWKVKDVKITEQYDEVVLINERTNEKKSLRGSKFKVTDEEISVNSNNFIEYFNKIGRESKTPFENLGQMIWDESEKRGVNPLLVAALIYKESSFDYKAFNSDSKATGLMQIIPSTGKEIGNEMGHPNLEDNTVISLLEIPSQNIEFGVYYLKKRLDDVGSNSELALASYNAGLGRLENWRGEKCIDDKTANWDTIISKLEKDAADPNGFKLYQEQDLDSGKLIKYYMLLGRTNYECLLPVETYDHVKYIIEKRNEYANALGAEITQTDEGTAAAQKSKNVNTLLEEKYKSIRLELNGLIATKKTYAEIEPVLKNYKTFLDEVRAENNYQWYMSYNQKIFRDIGELDKYYRTDTDIVKSVTAYISKNFNLAAPVSEEAAEEFGLSDSGSVYAQAIEDLRIVVDNDEYSNELLLDDLGNSKDNELVAMDAQLEIAEIYDHHLINNLNAIEEYRKLLALFPDYKDREFIEDRIKFLEETGLYLRDTESITEYGNIIQLTLYGTTKVKKANKALISVNGKSDYYSLEGGYTHKLGDTVWYLKEINNDNVVIARYGTNNYEDKKTLRLNNLNDGSLDGNLFVLEDIDIEQQVYITVLPGDERLTTKSNFMLHIPVEPRLWKLSKEQMNQQIDFTKKAISTLNNYINIIEDVYKWWSGTCYVTFVGLWVKNLFWFGAKDRNIARKEVMNAYKEKCTNKMESPKKNAESAVKVNYDGNIFNCITDEKKNIDDDLDAVQDVYNNNYDPKKNKDEERIKALAKKDFKNDLLNNKYDNEAFDILMREKVNPEDKKGKIYEDKLKDFLGDENNFDTNPNNPNGGGIDENNIDEKRKELLRPLGLKFEKGKFDPIKDPATIKTEIDDINKETENILEVSKSLYSDGYLYMSPEFISLDSIVYDENAKKVTEKVPEPNKKYFIIDRNTEKPKQIKFVDKVVEIEENHAPKLNLITSGKWKGRVDRLSVDSRRYLRVSKRGGDGNILEAELWQRYSEFGANDNLPLNTENAYRVKGPFNLDDCIRGSSSDIESVDIFRSLKLENYYKNLNNACRNLRNIDLKSELKNKKAGDKIDGYSIYNSVLESGGLQCFDIMEIDDCLFLFSVCDPVMCPASRFNAGGKWNVDNVVSTGIFGSIFLGTSLWRTKPIPEVGVCVPGINAGLKNYRSLLEGYQECLIARRDKGENVGICDTIRNIGVCKILWREGTSFFRLSGNTLDKLLGVISKEKGGGEYAFFQENIQKTGEFLNFFTNEYATTYFTAYRGASTDEIGEELCKAAIYGKIPGRGNLIDQLTKPEGPVQFTGWFMEVPNSDVGGDMLSDYEVYYHIYAGEDREQVRYYVYLQDVDDVSRRLIVHPVGTPSGIRYITKGDFVDETVRIQGSTGYDELCIWIENKVNCGFGRVSSDLLLDYLKDKSLENSYKKDIKNEQECIGESTVFSDPNLGNLADAFYPGITKSGIVRVCSKENPGKGVKENAWEPVGTCGNNNLNQELGRCWLNRETYRDALSEYDTERRNEAEELLTKISGEIDKDAKAKFVEAIKDYIEIIAKWDNKFKEIDTKSTEENSVTGMAVGNTEPEISNEINEQTNLGSLRKEMINDFQNAVNEFKKIQRSTLDSELSANCQYRIGLIEEQLALNLKKIETLEEERERKKNKVEITGEPSGATEEPTEEPLKDETNNLRYRLVFVDSGLGINLKYKWDGSSWIGDFRATFERATEIDQIKGHNEGLDEIKNVLVFNNYNKYYERLELYCGNNKRVLDYTLNQVKELEADKIITWIKENAKQCPLSLGDGGTYNCVIEYVIPGLTIIPGLKTSNVFLKFNSINTLWYYNLKNEVLSRDLWFPTTSNEHMNTNTYQTLIKQLRSAKTFNEGLDIIFNNAIKGEFLYGSYLLRIYKGDVKKELKPKKSTDKESFFKEVQLFCEDESKSQDQAYKEIFEVTVPNFNSNNDFSIDVNLNEDVEELGLKIITVNNRIVYDVTKNNQQDDLVKGKISFYLYTVGSGFAYTNGAFPGASPSVEEQKITWYPGIYIYSLTAKKDGKEYNTNGKFVIMNNELEVN